MSKKFNLKTYQKIDGGQHIDMRLKESRIDNIPDVINEKQLEDYRATEVVDITEKQLEKNRTGEETEITEKRLDTHKSKFANKYRNPEAHEGDMNKIEEQRLNGDPMEYEKYEAASSTPKQLRWWEAGKSPDGLKLAKKNSKNNIVAARNETEELAFDKPRWGDWREEEEIEVGTEAPQAIEEEVDIKEIAPKVTPTISKNAAEMSVVKQKDLLNKDKGLSAIFYVLSYNPTFFGGNEDKIQQAAMEKVLSIRPELSGVISSDNFSVQESFDEGKVTLRAAGADIDRIINKKQPTEVSPLTVEKPKKGGMYKELSYEEKDVEGTGMSIGRILVNPNIEIMTENREDIIAGALQYIKSKHPELDIEEDSLDLSSLDTVGKIGFMVGSPMKGKTEAISPRETISTETEFPIDIPEAPVRYFDEDEDEDEEYEDKRAEETELEDEPVEANTDFEIVTTAGSKKN